MQAEDRTLIRVQTEWNGWRSAEVRLNDLHDVHWFQPDRAPRPMIHGYISCASIVDGDIPHDCELTAGPHRLLVCYAELARRAGDQRLVAANPMPARETLEGANG